MALVSASSLYPYLPGLDSGADTPLGTLIAAVESQLAGWCGWPAIIASGTPASLSWDSAARTLYLDGPSATDPRMLQLPVQPVTAITSIYDDSTWTYTASQYLVSSSNYTLIEDTGELWLNPDASWSWSSGKRNIRVICTGGYVAATRQMSEAILRQCAYAYQLQKGGAGRKRSKGKDVSSEYDLPPIMPHVKHLLRDARCPTFWLS